MDSTGQGAALINAAPAGRVVAILGAESTGKTALGQAVVDTLRLQGHDAVLVPEYLRLFCDQHGRTPTQTEQMVIARFQTDAIAQAAQAHAWVVADTTALMTAVYSDIVFGDRGLYPMALAAHARADLTLLTALDVPWVADGIQRDGPHVREPVDDLLRHQLMQTGLAYTVVSGVGIGRLNQAWAAIAHRWPRPDDNASANDSPRVRWRWHCERCDDTDCELHSLQALRR
jgi:nicotinamide riboside kinase